MRITHEDGYPEAWICLCGNTPIADGFFPCNDKGQEIEPTKEANWDERSYVCARCGRIINQHTLEVTGASTAQI
jgi:hypothetical protein